MKSVSKDAVIRHLQKTLCNLKFLFLMGELSSEKHLIMKEQEREKSGDTPASRLLSTPLKLFILFIYSSQVQIFSATTLA